MTTLPVFYIVLPMENTGREEGTEMLVLRNRRGGKDTWHMDGCKVGEATAATWTADGFGHLVERREGFSTFQHRIHKACSKCGAEAARIADGYQRMFGGSK